MIFSMRKNSIKASLFRLLVMVSPLSFRWVDRSKLIILKDLLGVLIK